MRHSLKSTASINNGVEISFEIFNEDNSNEIKIITEGYELDKDHIKTKKVVTVLTKKDLYSFIGTLLHVQSKMNGK